MQQSRLSSPAADAGPTFGQIAIRRKWLLLLGVGLGVGLGYLYFTRQAPVYRSTAQILVQRNRPAMVLDATQQGNSSAADTIETQSLVVTSPIVVAAAVDKHGLADLPELGSRERALAMISRGLAANPARKQTEVMEISYLGSSPSECKAVLDGITAAYQEFLGDSARRVGEKMTTDIEAARNDLLPELDKLEAEYAAFRKSAPLLWQGEQGVNPHAHRLVEIEGQKTTLLLNRSQLQAKLDAIRDALARGGSREALSLMVDQLKAEGGRSEAVSVAEKLFPLMLEKELLSRNLGLAHPKVQSIQRQIELTREHLNELFDQGDGAERPRDLLDVYVDSLQYEIETTKVQEEKLAAVYETEKASAETLDEFLTKDAVFKETIDRKSRLLDAIIKRLDEIELFDGGGIRTEPIARPALGYRTSVEQTKHMAVGGVLGLLLAVGLAYALEVNDRSFRTPEDIRDELGAPVIGHVPVIAGPTKTGSESAAAVLCTVHAPKSQMSESFRLVRTALFFGARAGDLKVIQVTSPEQGDGKSTVSSNLAVTIAQSGRKTLLIDADMRRPTVHHLFHVSSESGLSTVIGGDADPIDAIRETVVPNLSVLPCGPRPHNPAELLSSPDFHRLLEWARDRYDFVIVDTPPLLAVSDPGNVAARVDGVVLTVRLGKRARAKAGEARQILDRFGANVLGVVINGVNARGDHGYHAAYRYTYGGSAGYGSYGGGDSVDEAASATKPVVSTPTNGVDPVRRLN